MSEAKNDYVGGDVVDNDDLNQIAQNANDGGGFRDDIDAGETINGGTLPVAVYQDTSDNELYACDADDADKLNFVGFVISNSTDGNPIDFQGEGIVRGFSGLSEGEYYYVQDDKTIGTSVGTYAVLVGKAISTTELLILKDPLTGLRDYLETSDNLKISADTEESVGTISPSWAEMKEIVILESGEIRVKHDSEATTISISTRIYVNGTAVGTTHNNSGAYTTYSDDIEVQAGDRVQLYAQLASGGTAKVRNFRIYFDQTKRQYGVVTNS